VRLNWKTLFVFMCGFVLLLLFLYWGLTIAEKGICELQAIQDAPLQAFSCTCRENGMQIIFAGRVYFFDCLFLRDFFSFFLPGRN
jgi:hypothetical protein